MSHLSLQDRLSTVEQDLVDALIAGGEKLALFCSNWASLADEIEHLHHHQHGVWDDATSTLVYEVFSRVTIISESAKSAYIHAEQFQVAADAELDDLFAGLDIQDPPVKSTHSVHVEADGISFSSAVEWLKKNITNPYPSKKDKINLCREIGIATSQLDDWFRSARRRIGWTSISRKYFNKSRKDTTKAASQALAGNYLDDFLDSSVRAEFLQMRDIAEVLLDEDMTSTQAGIAASKQSLASARERSSRSKSLSPTRISNCPSPMSTKRQRSPSSDCEDAPSKRICASLPKKRQVPCSSRATTPDLIKPSTKTSLSSRSPSPQDKQSYLCSDELHSKQHDASPVTAASPLTSVPASRKRRLSDSEGQVPRKRPFGQVKTRLHAVSDSHPSLDALTSVTDWLDNQSFSTPSPVPSASPDLYDSQLDVELQNWTNVYDSPTGQAQTIASNTLFDDFSPSQFLLNYDKASGLGLSTSFDDLSDPLDIGIYQWPIIDGKQKPAIHEPLTSIPGLDSSFDFINWSAIDELHDAFEPCPGLDFSPTPECAVSPSSSLDGDDLSDKLRKLQEHKEEVKKLEAEIAASVSVIV